MHRKNLGTMITGRKMTLERGEGEEEEENTRRKKHAFITVIYFGLKVGFFLSRRQKREKMMLKIRDRLRSREIGFESKD
jgi:23S rRNA G2069 N7-methylase RlmK/C1962 C5-methylase RlmI